jgi:hypothetical protein
MTVPAYPIRHPKDGSILLASFWVFLRLNALAPNACDGQPSAAPSKSVMNSRRVS